MTVLSNFVASVGRLSRVLLSVPLLAALFPVHIDIACPGASLQGGLPAQRVALPPSVSPGNPPAPDVSQKEAIPDSAPPQTVAPASEQVDRLQTTAAKTGKANAGGMRDPFRLPPPPPPPAQAKAAEKALAALRPPGSRGLSVGQLRLQGIVTQHSTRTMIAVVTSNDAHLSYFLRENEELYDGSVSRITPTAVYLREKLPDSSRGAKWREVVLKLEGESAELR